MQRKRSAHNLTTAQVARLLGVTKKTLYRMLQDGRIPEPVRNPDIGVLKNSRDRVDSAVGYENHAGDGKGHHRKRQHQSDDDKLERVMAVTGADIDFAIGVVQRMAAPQDRNDVQQPMHPIPLQVEDQNA